MQIRQMILDKETLKLLIECLETSRDNNLELLNIVEANPLSPKYSALKKAYTDDIDALDEVVDRIEEWNTDTK